MQEMVVKEVMKERGRIGSKDLGRRAGRKKEGKKQSNMKKNLGFRP